MRRAFTSLEAPGLRADDVNLIVPEYPLVQPTDVNHCDLTRLSDSVWRGLGQFHEEAKSNATA